MRLAILPFAAAVALSCGGKIVPDATVHRWCTQDTCTVTTITTVPTTDGLQLQARGLAVGGGFVYCATPTHLVRAPIAGGPFENVAAAKLVDAIIADDQNVYWSLIDGGVFELPHTGGVPIAFPVQLPPRAYTPRIAIDEQSLYWTEDPTIPGPQWVVQVPIGGGPRTTFAAPPVNTGPPQGGFAVRAGGAVVMGNAGPATVDVHGTTSLPAVVIGEGMVADGTDYFWAREGWGLHRPAAIVRTPIAGGDDVEMAVGPDSGEGGFNTFRMVVDDDALYFVVGAIGHARLVKMPKLATAHGQQTYVTTDDVWAYTVTADAIYWAALDGNHVVIKRMPRLVGQDR